MATAERIIMVYGGGNPLSDVLKYLECEHVKELALAIDGTMDSFITTLEKAAEAFAEISMMFDDVLTETTLYPTKWYNPTDRHNYRKMHCTPMLRRLRCRWRTRESRRSLDGLSPKTAIIDGDPRESEVMVF